MAAELWPLLVLYVLLGVLALLLSYIGVKKMYTWAESKQILDLPNERSSHTRPTPRGGGVVIVIISLLGWVVAWSQLPDPAWAVLAAYLVGAGAIALVSWFDDLYSLPNKWRFGVHLGGALLIVFTFPDLQTFALPVVGLVNLGWFGIAVAVLWIVGLTNAYNFMDGIDGMAGGQAVVAGVGWAILGGLAGQPLIGLLGVIVATSALGFLVHNWSPARIFMGDTGSAFLGFTFATLMVMALQTGPTFALAGALIVWPFVFDAGFTFFRRLLRGEKVFQAHRTHLYQRLVIAGYTHRFVSLLYTGLSTIGMAVAMVWIREVPQRDLWVMVVVPLLAAALWLFVQATETRRSSNVIAEP
jgi:UDP-N-acetylmuramyl pentapeptide phosphotransferase/UDP-N-acetylglucosamine-1-phosphate transferase